MTTKTDEEITAEYKAHMKVERTTNAERKVDEVYAKYHLRGCRSNHSDCLPCWMARFVGIDRDLIRNSTISNPFSLTKFGLTIYLMLDNGLSFSEPIHEHPRNFSTSYLCFRNNLQ